jgi:hypothetical protein
MPKGPQGQKRPADAIGRAVQIAKIATGELEDSPLDGATSEAATLGRMGGLKGGRARADKLTPERRAEIAAKAATARWGKKSERDD